MTEQEHDPIKDQDDENFNDEFEYLKKLQEFREKQIKNNPLMDPGY